MLIILERVIHVIEYNDAEQYHTYYTYDAAGDLTQMRNHYNTITAIAYNTLGQKISFVDPDMGGVVLHRIWIRW